MPTPPKPHLVLVEEGKSHRTKAELAQRKKAEKSLASGKRLKERKEVRDNPVAHAEYQRLNRLLKGIEKNDALYEAVINRYCILQAECKEMEEKREQIYKALCALEVDRDRIIDEGNVKFYYRTLTDMQKNMISIDKQVQSKRIMLLNIEKENIMTIAAALRSIPKKVEQEETDPLKGLNKYG